VSSQRDFDSSGSSSSSDVAADQGVVDYRLRFIECIFGPAVMKLLAKSNSRVKGIPLRKSGTLTLLIG